MTGVQTCALPICGAALLDLDYSEDSTAEVDANVVMTGDGGLVEVQATAERTPLSRASLDELLALAADGGTRCASITGAMVALSLALRALVADGRLAAVPLTGTVAAVSAGIVDGVALLDLDYSEDSTAEVDANVVMTGDGGLVEVQATAERTPLSRAHLDALLSLAAGGIEELRAVQEQTVADAGVAVGGA